MATKSADQRRKDSIKMMRELDVELDDSLDGFRHMKRELNHDFICGLLAVALSDPAILASLVSYVRDTYRDCVEVDMLTIGLSPTYHGADIWWARADERGDYITLGPELTIRQVLNFHTDEVMAHIDALGGRVEAVRQLLSMPREVAWEKSASERLRERFVRC